MTGREGSPTDLAQSPAEERLNALLAGLAEGQPRVSLAAAESCTGGNVAARITAIAGSSDYFLGSIVSYSNEAKSSLLGVSQEILDTRGAVSAECARAMAAGARRVFGANLAVATTGIAGPSGATARKPVGLVYIALAGPDGVAIEEFHFPGGRKTITDAATEAALLMLLRAAEARLGQG
jgi:PncC family amidohydrolase